MRTDEFVMRGQTASGKTETLNFSGFKPGYAYRLVEFSLYPSTGIGTQTHEVSGTIVAGKSSVLPTDPDFNNDGLIATSTMTAYSIPTGPTNHYSVINDTFLITQNLILMVIDTQSNPVNWQCKFMPVKLNKSEEAVANYKQFLISDDS